MYLGRRVIIEPVLMDALGYPQILDECRRFVVMSRTSLLCKNSKLMSIP